MGHCSGIYKLQKNYINELNWDRNYYYYYYYYFVTHLGLGYIYILHTTQLLICLSVKIFEF
jgi:hypothetical protein